MHGKRSRGILTHEHYDHRDFDVLSSSPDDSFVPLTSAGKQGAEVVDPAELADLELALYLSTVPDSPPSASADKPSSSAISSPSPSPSAKSTSSPLSANPSGGRSQKRKEVSLNHLLRFNVTPSSEAGSQSSSISSPSSSFSSSSSSKSFHSHQSAAITSLKKALFIQANYRLILHHGGNYQYLLNDPDAVVRWSDVAQVCFDTEEAVNYQCPICLEPPRVPRMTPCGHVFCYVCLLQVVAFSGAKTISCPMCNETVLLSDLRSVAMLDGVHHKKAPPPTSKVLPGSTVHFALLQRQRSSTFAAPAELWQLSPDLLSCDILPHTDPLSRFSRFSTTSSVAEIIEIEEQELQEMLREARSCADRSVPYIEAALTQLEHDYEHIQKRFRELTRSRASYLPSTLNSSNGSGSSSPLDGFSSSSSYSGSWSISGSSGTSSGIGSGPSSSLPNGKNDDKGPILFYQSEDGQLLFLDPLNSRMLLAHYGSFDAFPHYLPGVVVGVQNLHLELDVRRRSPWLAHLPLSTPLTLVEIALNKIVSREVMQQFSKELKARKKKRALLKEPAPPPTAASPPKELPPALISPSDFPLEYPSLAYDDTAPAVSSPTAFPALSASTTLTTPVVDFPALSGTDTSTTSSSSTASSGTSVSETPDSSTTSIEAPPTATTPGWGSGATFADVLKGQPKKQTRAPKPKRSAAKPVTVTVFSTGIPRRR